MGLSGTPYSSTKSLFLILVQIISGLILLIVGSDLLVKGAIGIAQQMNLSEALIGLTIVALGTSTPELAVSVMAAWKGNNNIDRKSTRLNSSHVAISYAVFCLKKK